MVFTIFHKKFWRTCNATELSTSLDKYHYTTPQKSHTQRLHVGAGHVVEYTDIWSCPVQGVKQPSAWRANDGKPLLKVFTVLDMMDLLPPRRHSAWLDKGFGLHVLPYARLFTKSQICISCFGYTNPGHFASFNLRTALQVTCWLCFPPIPSFHLSRAPRLPCRLTLTLSWTTIIRMRLANGSDLTALASVSSFRLPLFLPEFGAAAYLLFEFVFVNCKLWLSTRLCLSPLCLTKSAPPGILPSSIKQNKTSFAIHTTWAVARCGVSL